MPEQHFSHIKTITMTAEERASMRHQLHAYTIAHAAESSPRAHVWAWVMNHGVLVLGLLMVIFAGATSVSASLAQPGDTLYPFRLAVNDRIETAMAFSDDAQIDVEMQQLQRMIDAENSAVTDELGELAIDAETDSVQAVSDDFEAEMRALEQDIEQEAATDVSTGINPIFQKSSEDVSIENELRSIEHDLQDEEARSHEELE